MMNNLEHNSTIVADEDLAILVQLPQGILVKEIK
jgi:hypothetical protein